mmetsp:Transcript_2460/g.3991  ORF Transcript_2460/g.3991 Transcript_2460/m.3991 type:complete len:220 (-) Transcript_2460:340-999(-)
MQALQVVIILSSANKHDGFPRLVRHGNGSANFIIDGIKLGQNDAIDQVRISIELQRSIKLHQLIDSVISDQRFADKQGQIRLIALNERHQRAHQRRIVLHSACSVDEHHIVFLLLALLNGSQSDSASISRIALTEQPHIECTAVRLQLFHCAASKRIARSHAHSEIARFEVMNHLRQRSRFPHAVHSDKHHGKRSPLFLRRADAMQNVNRTSWSQDALQ